MKVKSPNHWKGASPCAIRASIDYFGYAAYRRTIITDPEQVVTRIAEIDAEFERGKPHDNYIPLQRALIKPGKRVYHCGPLEYRRRGGG